jgi:hypothetical protein
MASVPNRVVAHAPVVASPLTLVLMAGWLLFTVLLGVIYARVPPNPDQSMFDYIGWVVSHGGVLYVDAGELNWPGAMLLHAAASALFGNELWSFRLFDYLELLASCGLLLAFLRLSELRTAGWLVVPVYQMIYVSSGPWYAGQRDVVASHFMVACIAAVLARLRGGHVVLSLVAGAALLVAVLFRPTYLLLALFLPLSLVLARGHGGPSFPQLARELGLAAAGALGTAATVAIVGWHTGALAEWFNMAVRFNLEVYGGDGPSWGAIIGRTLHLFVSYWHWHSSRPASAPRSFSARAFPIT